ncbi:MAG: hypothetical protein ACRDTK_08230 [Mycobacterium sp.]
MTPRSATEPPGRTAPAALSRRTPGRSAAQVGNAVEVSITHFPV